MIMTKEKHKQFNQNKRSAANSHTDAPPPTGQYQLSSTQSVAELSRATARGDADFVVMGMIIPASKAATLCRTLHGENGTLPAPVIILKKAYTPYDRNTVEETPAEPNFPVPFPIRNNAAPEIRIRDLEIIPGRHEVKVRGKKVTLTFSEFRILQTLASHPGWVFDRARIIHAVHGEDYNCTDRAVDVQVTGLRKKLGVAGDYIQTVRGVGYRFVE
jgi:two-component system alkaline phosphatase synthesis response regulator PhoP